MSASLRKFLITRLLLTIPMVLILITVVFSSCASSRVIPSARSWGPKSVRPRPTQSVSGSG